MFELFVLDYVSLSIFELCSNFELWCLNLFNVVELWCLNLFNMVELWLNYPAVKYSEFMWNMWEM